MSAYPSLTHISIGALIGEAGGDPWQVDETMQSGDPGAIAELGRAFYSAGACTAETYAEFEQAQARFRASWNREGGEHPINDSAEVQRATTRLLVQRDQLPAIGADLSGIAANLA
ncbi:putative alpha/beta hydrolase, partial [Mycobacterium pinniadriaticum]